MCAYKNDFYDWNPNFDLAAHYWPDTTYQAHPYNKDMTAADQARHIIASTNPAVGAEAARANSYMYQQFAPGQQHHPMMPTFENQYQRYDYIGAQRPRMIEHQMYPSTMKCTPEYHAASTRIRESDKGYSFDQGWRGSDTPSYYDAENLEDGAVGDSGIVSILNNADHFTLFLLIVVLFLAVLGSVTILKGIMKVFDGAKSGGSEWPDVFTEMREHE